MRARSIVAVACVAGSTLLAYAAVGNGDIRATPEVTVVTVTSTTGSGSGTAALQNTTTAMTYQVNVGSDATCDPDVTFTVQGGNPISSFAPSTTRNVTIGCPPRDTEPMKRCLFHATNNLSGAPLADFMGVCLYGSAAGTVTPLQTAIDFGSVPVGDFAEQRLMLRNDSTLTQPITRVALHVADLEGNFQLSAPCNPDATFCDQELTAAAGSGSTFSVDIKCRPQTVGTHTAQLYVGTNTFQLLSTGVTLQCTGTQATTPALGIHPTTIAIPSPIEINGDTAQVTVYLENIGSSTLVVRDVRTVDVDTGAAADWSYTASGECSGQINTMCSLGAGDRVAIELTFDPSEIGSRRAALLVSYRDSIDRTAEIPLDATGLGATLRLLDLQQTALSFGRVPVGRTSSIDLTLVNDGNRNATAMLSLDMGATPPFTLTPATTATVAPTMPRTISLACTPTTAGTFMTNAQIQSMDTVTSPGLMIAATCEGTTEPLYTTPSTLRLGEVRVNAAPVTRVVQVLSDTAPTQVTLTGQPQLETSSTSITLGSYSAASTPASFDVTVVPQAPGSLTNAIIVTTSDGDTLRIPISATAVEASYFVATTYELGTFCVDQPTTPSSVALASDGTATIDLDAPTLAQSPSPFDLAFLSPPLYPHPLSGGRTALVSVTPKRQLAAVTVSDTLTWRTDVASAPTSATQLTAKFIDSGAAIAPPALSFGEVTVHLFSDNGQRVVIQNCNPTPLVLNPPSIRTPFSIDSPNFPAMLNPNESIAFSVGFHPTRVGPVSETLRITSPQLPAGAALDVVLTGVGGSGNSPEPDAGTGSNKKPDDTSFYACACDTSRPVGILPIAIVLVCVLFPRRRRR